MGDSRIVDEKGRERGVGYGFVSTRPVARWPLRCWDSATRDMTRNRIGGQEPAGSARKSGGDDDGHGKSAHRRVIRPCTKQVRKSRFAAWKAPHQFRHVPFPHAPTAVSLGGGSEGPAHVRTCQAHLANAPNPSVAHPQFPDLCTCPRVQRSLVWSLCRCSYVHSTLGSSTSQMLDWWAAAQPHPLCRSIGRIDIDVPSSVKTAHRANSPRGGTLWPVRIPGLLRQTFHEDPL